MKQITQYLAIISILSITACVPESEHNKVVSERNELAIKNDSLKKNLKELNLVHRIYYLMERLFMMRTNLLKPKKNLRH